MPHKEAEARREYQKEQMRRRRAMMKEQEPAVITAQAEGQESEAQRQATETPQQKRPAAATPTTQEKKRLQEPPPYSHEERFMYINTGFGKVRGKDHIAQIIYRRFKQREPFVLVQFSTGDPGAIVICKNQNARENPRCPDNIPDFTLEDDWEVGDIENLLISLN